MTETEARLARLEEEARRMANLQAVPPLRKEEGAGGPILFSEAEAGFWARLTAKTYVAGDYIAYSWTRVNSDDSPDPIDWNDLSETSTTTGMPAYEAHNVDLPVHATVPFLAWMQQGDGAYKVFEQNPRIEIVRKTSEPDEDGYMTGFLQRWHQTDLEWDDTEAILIRDANAL